MSIKINWNDPSVVVNDVTIPLDSPDDFLAAAIGQIAVELDSVETSLRERIAQAQADLTRAAEFVEQGYSIHSLPNQALTAITEYEAKRQVLAQSIVRLAGAWKAETERVMQADSIPCGA